VRPVGIGEVWRGLFAKCVIAVAGGEAKDICGAGQPCAGLAAGIEGATYTVTQFWKDHEEEDDCGFLLIDARNAFNEGNRTAFLWTVRHL